jgi:hypothetical protein
MFVSVPVNNTIVINPGLYSILLAPVNLQLKNKPAYIFYHYNHTKPFLSILTILKSYETFVTLTGWYKRPI